MRCDSRRHAGEQVRASDRCPCRDPPQATQRRLFGEASRLVGEPGTDLPRRRSRETVRRTPGAEDRVANQAIPAVRVDLNFDLGLHRSDARAPAPAGR